MVVVVRGLSRGSLPALGVAIIRPKDIGWGIALMKTITITTIIGAVAIPPTMARVEWLRSGGLDMQIAEVTVIDQ